MRFAKCKKMSNIYLNTEQKSRPQRPEHGNNCNGHFTSIANGCKGHSIGDGYQLPEVYWLNE